MVKHKKSKKIIKGGDVSKSCSEYQRNLLLEGRQKLNTRLEKESSDIDSALQIHPPGDKFWQGTTSKDLFDKLGFN